MKRLLLISLLLNTFSNLLFAQSPFPILAKWKGDTLENLGGAAVAMGDINSDSFADFGLLSWTQGWKIHLGANPFDTATDYVWPLGLSHMANVGDLNGDGRTDYAKDRADGVGIFFGPVAFPDTTPSLVLHDPMMPPGSGGPGYASADLISADIDRDGFNDLITVFDRGIDGYSYCLFRGGSPMDTSPSWKLSFPAFRSTVRGVGGVALVDVNNDSFPDILMGLVGIDNTGQDSLEGLVQVYLSRPILDTIPDDTIHSPIPIQQDVRMRGFGYQIFALGDINADSHPDFIVSSQNDTGRYFYEGQSSIPHNPTFAFPPGSILPGDVNGDGYVDLVRNHPTGGFGRIEVFVGGPSFDFTPDAFITASDFPPDFLDYAGAIAVVGDVNKDGPEDFLVQAHQFIGGDARSEVFLFGGSSDVKTGVKNEGGTHVPKNFQLDQNYPNPFNSNTVISYTLNKRSSIRLEIFNIAGQLLKVLLNQELPAGTHKISWDGTDSLGKRASSGIYFYKLQSGDEAETKKMILIR